MKVVFIATLLAASAVFSATGSRDMKPSNLSNFMSKTALYIDLEFKPPGFAATRADPKVLGAYTFSNKLPSGSTLMHATYSQETSENSQFGHDQEDPCIPDSTPVHSGVPYVENGKIKIDDELPHSWVYGGSNQTNRTWEGTLYVEVPAQRTYRANLCLQDSAILMRYEGTVHYDDTPSSKVEGLWQGTNYHEPFCVAVDITESLRTRNGGCQEECLASCEDDVQRCNLLATELTECYASQCDCPGTVVVCSSAKNQTSFLRRRFID